MNFRITLSAIARKAGCSVSAVSIALRGSQRLPKETREKIQRIADEMGYRPNPVLSALASKQFKNVPSGIPLAFFTQHGAHGPDEDFLYERLRHYAADLGYDLQVYHLPDLQKSTHPARMLYQRGIEGIILSFFFEMEALPGMDWSLFAVAALGGGLAAESTLISFHHAKVDCSHTVRRSWSEAVKAGYGRIGLFLLEHQYPIPDDIQRHSAGLYCLSQTRHKDRIPIFRARLFHLTDPYEQTRPDRQRLAKWMKRYQPEVVIGFSDYIIWLLDTIGWKIPDRVAFISLEKDPNGRGVAGMESISNKMNLAAFELIDFQIRHRLRGMPTNPRAVSIIPRWIPGSSLPLKKSKRRSR